MKKSTLYFSIIIVLLISNVSIFSLYKNSSETLSKTNGYWTTASDERDTCRSTLKKVGDETINMLEKKYQSPDDLAGYYSKVVKVMKDDGAIKEIAK